MCDEKPIEQGQERLKYIIAGSVMVLSGAGVDVVVPLVTKLDKNSLVLLVVWSLVTIPLGLWVMLTMNRRAEQQIVATTSTPAHQWRWAACVIGTVLIIVYPCWKYTRSLTRQSEMSATSGHKPNLALIEGQHCFVMARLREATEGKAVSEDYLRKAEACYTQAIKQAETAGKDGERELAECYCGLGEVKEALEDRAAARKHYEAAKEHAKASNDGPLVREIEKRIDALARPPGEAPTSPDAPPSPPPGPKP
jgi:hypothetical protein